jgi:hypothetical protein
VESFAERVTSSRCHSMVKRDLLRLNGVKWGEDGRSVVAGPFVLATGGVGWECLLWEVKSEHQSFKIRLGYRVPALDI